MAAPIILKAIINGLVMLSLNGDAAYVRQGDTALGVTIEEVGVDWVRLSSGRTIYMGYASPAPIERAAAHPDDLSQPFTRPKIDHSKPNYGLSSAQLHRLNSVICQRSVKNRRETRQECMARVRRFDEEFNARFKVGKKS